MIFTTKNLLAQDTRQYFQRKQLEFKSFLAKENYWVLPKYSDMTIFLLTYMIDYIINLIFREPCQKKKLHKKMDKVYLQINFEKNSSNLLWGNALSYVRFTMESQHKFKGKDHRITFFQYTQQYYIPRASNQSGQRQQCSIIVALNWFIISDGDESMTVSGRAPFIYSLTCQSTRKVQPSLF